MHILGCPAFLPFIFIIIITIAPCKPAMCPRCGAFTGPQHQRLLRVTPAAQSKSALAHPGKKVANKVNGDHISREGLLLEPCFEPTDRDANTPTCTVVASVVAGCRRPTRLYKMDSRHTGPLLVKCILLEAVPLNDVDAPPTRARMWSTLELDWRPRSMQIWHLLHRRLSHVSWYNIARRNLCANRHSPAQPSGTWGKRGKLHHSCQIRKSKMLR